MKQSRSSGNIAHFVVPCCFSLPDAGVSAREWRAVGGPGPLQANPFLLLRVTVALFPVPTKLGFFVAGVVAACVSILHFHFGWHFVIGVLTSHFGKNPPFSPDQIPMHPNLGPNSDVF